VALSLALNQFRTIRFSTVREEHLARSVKCLLDQVLDVVVSFFSSTYVIIIIPSKIDRISLALKALSLSKVLNKTTPYYYYYCYYITLIIIPNSSSSQPHRATAAPNSLDIVLDSHLSSKIHPSSSASATARSTPSTSGRSSRYVSRPLRSSELGSPFCSR
jgi:hypothetical protein